MSATAQLQHLPVDDRKERFVKVFSEHQAVLAVGATGSGKTTRFPQFVLDRGLLPDDGLIICTQPRRLAAIGVAMRIAEERGVEIGQEIGYHIRFERRLSKSTRLASVTAGILLRQTIIDPLLSSISCVIVDEAHERDIYTDLLLGYLKRVCALRPDFKLVVMSATLDWRAFAEFLPGAGMVRVPVRTFPVEIEYHAADYRDDMFDRMCRDIHWITQTGNKDDFLVFLPGERDIREFIGRLRSWRISGLHVLPLYGALSPMQQRQAFEQARGTKVIVSTNLAESSITLGRITVLDSGLAKVPRYDAQLDADTLDTERISQSSADQRAGRAGRVAPGKCIRYYTNADFLSRSQFDKPQILTNDLTSLVLTMKSLGLDYDFDLPTRPPTEAWRLAEKKLQSFVALDAKGVITSHGRDMVQLPLEPRLANFVLQNKRTAYGCLNIVVIIAAMLTVGRFFVQDLEDGDAMERAKERFRSPGGDFMTLWKIWRAYSKSGFSDEWCYANQLNPQWMRAARTMRAEIRRTLTRLHVMDMDSEGRYKEHVGAAIVRGFLNNLLAYHRNYTYRALRTSEPVSLFPDSSLFERLPPFVVYYQLRRTTRLYAHCNHLVSHAMLKRIAPGALVPKSHKSAPKVNEPVVRIGGVLRISKGHHQRAVHVDVNLVRGLDNKVSLVNNGSFALDEASFPITFLSLSPESVSALKERDIRVLCDVPTTLNGLKALGLAESYSKEILGTMRQLGYVAPDLPPKQVEVTESKSTEVIAKSFGNKGKADASARLARDRSIEELYGKSLEDLGFSTTARLHLLGLGAINVEELMCYSEDSLRKAMKKNGKVREDVIGEVRAKLVEYGLHLVKHNRNDNSWRVRTRQMNEADESSNDQGEYSEELVMELLGDQFELFKQFREGDESQKLLARNALTELNMGLCRKVAGMNSRRLERGSKELMIEWLDLVQEGAIGLMRSIETFRLEQEGKFSTYSMWWIRQVVTRFLDQWLHPVRVPTHMSDKIKSRLFKLSDAYIELSAQGNSNPTRADVAQHLGMNLSELEELMRVAKFWQMDSLDRPLKEGRESEPDLLLADTVADERESTEEQFINHQLIEFAHELVSEGGWLEADRHALELYFGLNGNREHTLAQIGQQYGVTGERIRQRIEKVLNSLRTKENWERGKAYLPWLPPPGYVRTTDTSIGQSVSERIQRTRRSREDIADELVRRGALAHEVDMDELKKGMDVESGLIILRRHLVGELVNKAKLSLGFVAEYFNMLDAMAVEEELAHLNVDNASGSARSADTGTKAEWTWQAMRIVLGAAEDVGCSGEDVFSRTTGKHVEQARGVAILRLRDELKLPFHSIARFLGDRNEHDIIHTYFRFKREQIKDSSG